jgi:hypothetical protein
MGEACCKHDKSEECVYWFGGKKLFGKDKGLGRRIIFKPTVNENIHLAWTYCHRMKLLRTLRFREMWGIS